MDNTFRDEGIWEGEGGERRKGRREGQWLECLHVTLNSEIKPSPSANTGCHALVSLRNKLQEVETNF